MRGSNTTTDVGTNILFGKYHKKHRSWPHISAVVLVVVVVVAVTMSIELIDNDLFVICLFLKLNFQFFLRNFFFSFKFNCRLKSPKNCFRFTKCLSCISKGTPVFCSCVFFFFWENPIEKIIMFKNFTYFSFYTKWSQSNGSWSGRQCYNDIHMEKIDACL